MKKIGIIGLGYVGLPLAVEFGKQRYVLGFDINARRIDELNNCLDVTREVNEKDLREAKNLIFSCVESELAECEIFIVTVPTPIDEVNRPDFRPLLNACEIVGRNLSSGAIVIFESTVYPGATEEVCVPIIEKYSGKKYNKEFFCGYSPERINPGDKVNTLKTIKKITSGSTNDVADEIADLYAEIIDAGIWKAGSIAVAEAAKVIENSQRDLNIAFVNELSLIFDKIGIDTLEVLEAAGSKWNFLNFRPGMVGGHCIGVDPYYLTYKAEQLGYHPEIILAGRRLNDNMARYAAQSTIKLMIGNGIDVANSRVGIFGLTFKENCPDIRNSKVVDLINEFNDWGVKTVVTDPWSNKAEVMAEYGIELTEANTWGKVDSLILAVGHSEFRQLSVIDLRRICNSTTPVLADLKGIYNKIEAENAGFTVFRL